MASIVAAIIARKPLPIHCTAFSARLVTEEPAAVVDQARHDGRRHIGDRRNGKDQEPRSRLDQQRAQEGARDQERAENDARLAPRQYGHDSPEQDSYDDHGYAEPSRPGPELPQPAGFPAGPPPDFLAPRFQRLSPVVHPGNRGPPIPCKELILVIKDLVIA